MPEGSLLSEGLRLLPTFSFSSLSMLVSSVEAAAVVEGLAFLTADFLVLIFFIFDFWIIFSAMLDSGFLPSDGFAFACSSCCSSWLVDGSGVFGFLCIVAPPPLTTGSVF